MIIKAFCSAELTEMGFIHPQMNIFLVFLFKKLFPSSSKEVFSAWLTMAVDGKQ